MAAGSIVAAHSARGHHAARLSGDGDLILALA